MTLVLFQYLEGTFDEKVPPAWVHSQPIESWVLLDLIEPHVLLKDCRGDVWCQIYLFNLYCAFQMQTTDTQALGTSTSCYFQKCILDVYGHNNVS